MIELNRTFYNEKWKEEIKKEKGDANRYHYVNGGWENRFTFVIKARCEFVDNWEYETPKMGVDKVVEYIEAIDPTWTITEVEQWKVYVIANPSMTSIPLTKRKLVAKYSVKR